MIFVSLIFELVSDFLPELALLFCVGIYLEVLDADSKHDLLVFSRQPRTSHLFLLLLFVFRCLRLPLSFLSFLVARGVAVAVAFRGGV